MKESTKAKIDAMTKEELSYHDRLGLRSPYQREKMVHIRGRLAQLKSELKAGEDIANAESRAKSNQPHYWYQKPLGIIFYTVFSGFLVLCLGYIAYIHFGIPL